MRKNFDEFPDDPCYAPSNGGTRGPGAYSELHGNADKDLPLPDELPGDVDKDLPLPNENPSK